MEINRDLLVSKLVTYVGLAVVSYGIIHVLRFTCLVTNILILG